MRGEVPLSCDRRRFGAALGGGALGLLAGRAAAEEGPAGAFTDVPGLKVGHFTDTRRPTGCTVVLPGAGRGLRRRRAWRRARHARDRPARPESNAWRRCTASSWLGAAPSASTPRRASCAGSRSAASASRGRRARADRAGRDPVRPGRRRRGASVPTPTAGYEAARAASGGRGAGGQRRRRRGRHGGQVVRAGRRHEGRAGHGVAAAAARRSWRRWWP